MVTPTLPEMSVNEFQQHGEEVIKVYRIVILKYDFLKYA